MAASIVWSSERARHGNLEIAKLGQALADALRSGHLGGAGVDVLTEEPPRNGNVLLDPSIPNLIVTPHVAWAARESRGRVMDQLRENIAAFLAGEPIRVVGGGTGE